MSISKVKRIANRLWLKHALELIECQLARHVRVRRASKAVSAENLNPRIARLQYNVRGPLAHRADELQQELNKGDKKKFKKVINANISDAQSLGQRPITFIRQVVACVADPSLLGVQSYYPDDVKRRAGEILYRCKGCTIGSTSDPCGHEAIRHNVAQYLWKRDTFNANHNNILLCAGASSGIRSVLELLANDIGGKPTGVMVPIPQSPLYSASLEELGLQQVFYHLNEEANWAVSSAELDRALAECKDKCNVRAIVVINPGNPTGHVMSDKNMEDIVRFAHTHGLMILADEVYQENIYLGKFQSFKRMMRHLGGKIREELQLASFMSASKGYLGESGLRAGWMELVNFEPQVRASLVRKLSTFLCPNTLGQTAVDCLAKPPRPWEPSFDLWSQQVIQTLKCLKDRSKYLVETFNGMKGVKCNPVQGAMFAFPKFNFTTKVIQAAKKDNMSADEFYASRLLEETGVCVIAGTGFGQKPDTFHLRASILPQPELMKEMCSRLQGFHDKFVKEYGTPETPIKIDSCHK